MIPALVAYKAQINTDISTQSAPDSIDPATVGAGYTDLVDIIDPYLEFDANRVFSAGSTVPSDLDGADGDIYFQGEANGTVTIWQKVTGSWVDNGSFMINGQTPIAGTSDSSGNFDLTSFSPPTTPMAWGVFDFTTGDSIPVSYNRSTKIMSGFSPSQQFIGTMG